MLDKIFNRKYLKAMKRLGLQIERLVEEEQQIFDAKNKRTDYLEYEKGMVTVNEWEKDEEYRILDFMGNYVNHKKVALLEMRADLLTYVS